MHGTGENAFAFSSMPSLPTSLDRLVPRHHDEILPHSTAVIDFEGVL